MKEDRLDRFTMSTEEIEAILDTIELPPGADKNLINEIRQQLKATRNTAPENLTPKERKKALEERVKILQERGKRLR